MLDEVVDWVVEAEQVAVLTGAGVSTASGIPDFRGPNGLWTREPEAERLSSIDAYVSDPEVRREAWQRRAAIDPSAIRPNPAHYALAELEQLGRLHMLVTQNVDGLHLDAGTSPERLVEIHGTARAAACLSCGDRQPMEAVLERVRAGEADPRCDGCGGLVKSATISFGQALEPTELQRAHDAAVGCDLMITVGTSLVVYPVAMLPQTAQEAGARLVVINAEETPYDGRADAVVRGDAGEVLTAIVAGVRDRLG